MAHIEGKTNASSVLMTSLDETLCRVDHSLVLTLLPSNNVDIAESSLLAGDDNVDIMFLTAVIKNLLPELAVIIHMISEKCSHGGLV